MTSGALFRPIITSVVLFCAQPLFGGVVVDKSFGPAKALPGPNFMIPANLGKQMGGNLFQSFSQFDLNSTQSATFTGPANVQNILSRVTSGSPSSIDGKISSQISGANLFFLNPAGVMFGSHAQLDVSGSVAISTANYLKMADGGRFNANLGGSDSLTSAPVSSFGFLSGPQPPQSVHFDHAQINMQPATGLHVVAGDVALDGTTLKAPSGTLTIFSAASAGEVAFDPTAPEVAYSLANFAALGAVSLGSGSLASIDGIGGGGRVAIRSGTLTVDNSMISSTNYGSLPGGNISLQVDGNFSVINAGQITASALGSGDGGQINISAGHVYLAGVDSKISTESAISITVSLDIDHTFDSDLTISLTNPSGRTIDLLTRIGGGDDNIHTTLSDAAAFPITEGTPPFLGTFRPQSPLRGLSSGPINGTWRLAVTDNAAVDVGTLQNWALGLGGITVTSTDVPKSIQDFQTTTSIIPVIFAFVAGRGGDIHIQSPVVQIMDGARLSANTFSDGRGGSISVESGSIRIGGTGSTNDAGIQTNALGTGDGGNINLRALGDIRILDGGFVESTTSANGRGGSIFVTSANLEVSGGREFDFTGQLSVATSGKGAGGNITLEIADHVLLANSLDSITANAFGTGDGGSVSVNCGSLEVSRSDISMQTTGPGTGGNLNFSVSHEARFFDSSVLMNTAGAGQGGSIHLESSSLVLTFSGLDTETDGSGMSGDISLAVSGMIQLEHGEFSSSSHPFGEVSGRTNNAGSIEITSASLSLDNGSDIAAVTEGNGTAGTITLTVGDLRINDSVITSSTDAKGNGGSIHVASDSVLIEGMEGRDSGIFAVALFNPLVEGRGGNAGSIFVDAGSLRIFAGGQISSSTFDQGDGGNVNVRAGSLFVDGVGSGIFATAGKDSSGVGGSVTVNGGTISLVDNGSISATSFTSKAAGSVTLGSLTPIATLSLSSSSSISSENTGGGAAGIVAITASGPIELTGSSSISTSAHGGIAGGVIVHTNDLAITQGAEISSSTFGAGHGGDINVTADSVFVDGAGSNISAEADAGTGSGGTVRITGDSLLLQNAGSVSAKSLTSGTAGSVGLTLGTLTMDSDGLISSANTGTGPAGGVIIHTSGPATFRHGSSISVQSEFSDAGGIDLFSDGVIKLSSGSTITASAGTNALAGNIHIRAPDLVYLKDSSIIASAGREPNGSGFSGRGGNITIDPRFIILRNGTISANAATGQGGNINLVSDFFFNSDSLITATGTTNNGTVNITAPQLDLGAELITLQSSLIGAETQLQERCTALLQGDYSSFITVGRGGTEPPPDELQTTF